MRGACALAQVQRLQVDVLEVGEDNAKRLIWTIDSVDLVVRTGPGAAVAGGRGGDGQ